MRKTNRLLLMMMMMGCGDDLFLNLIQTDLKSLEGKGKTTCQGGNSGSTKLGD